MGAGAEMRQAMGVAVFSGMIGVTVFGIFLTPVFYVILRMLSGNKPLKHAGDVAAQRRRNSPRFGSRACLASRSASALATFHRGRELLPSSGGNAELRRWCGLRPLIGVSVTSDAHP